MARQHWKAIISVGLLTRSVTFGVAGTMYCAQVPASAATPCQLTPSADTGVWISKADSQLQLDAPHTPSNGFSSTTLWADNGTVHINTSRALSSLKAGYVALYYVNGSGLCLQTYVAFRVAGRHEMVLQNVSDVDSQFFQSSPLLIVDAKSEHIRIGVKAPTSEKMEP